MLALWGKKREVQNGGREASHHPLVYHLLDSAAVATAICNRLNVNRTIVLSNLSREATAYLTALHDIGKATPGFQSLSPVAVSLLAEAGLGARARYEHRHNVLTKEIIDRESIPALDSLDSDVRKKLALILGGHHGEFPQPGRARALGHETGGEPWIEARRKLLEQVFTVLGPETLRLDSLSIPAALELSGLIAVADWISSNESFFPYTSESIELARYYQESLRKADSALDSLHWHRPVSEHRSFRELFPDLPELRPLQETLVSCSDSIKGQCFAIIEAPMGEGKTEAALFLASHLSDLGQEGCYFALPTRATSDQMFRRAAQYLQLKYRDEMPNLILLHGDSSLSSTIKVMGNSPVREFMVSGMEDVVQINTWFTNKRRGLLSLYGVGTIDQVLMAAIRTKHICVKLFGLQNKTVIIDEVHAYDLYMTTLLKRLISWLAKLGCSVLLLSATLSDKQKKDLIDSFCLNAGFDYELPHVAYPRVSLCTKEGTVCKSFSTSKTSRKTVEIRHTDAMHEDTIDTLSSELRGALSDGGCAAVICNTVDKAQSVYLGLKSYFGQDIDLLHARFMHKDREIREGRNISRFSRGGQRPDRFVLIATQIIEQSLDVDFDLIVTEHAPVDFVLQRLGRLWRHDIRRPASIDGPVCYLNSPSAIPPPKSVYDPYLLLKSWVVLKDRSSIQIPDEMEGLIEQVYGDRPLDVPSELEGSLQEALADYLKDCQVQEVKASSICVPWPDDDAISVLRQFTQDARFEDSPLLHAELQALTRLTTPSVSVICLFGDENDAYLDSELTTSLDLMEQPAKETTRRILMNSATITGPEYWVREFREDSRCPKAWEGTPLLKNYYPLFFTDGRAQCRDYVLTLDSEIGIRKEYRGNGV